MSIFLKSKYFSHKTKRATKNEVLNFFPPQAAVARLPSSPVIFPLLQFVIAVTASDGDCYMSNFRPRQCGLFIVILSSTLSLKTVVFFYPLLFLRSLSPRLKYSRTALCMDTLTYAPYFRQRFAPFFRHRRRSQGYLQVPSSLAGTN